MTSKTYLLLKEDLTQVCLEVSSTDIDQAWEKSRSHSTPNSRENAFINRICLKVILPWLQEKYEQEVVAWSNVTTWELVNGTAVTVGGARFIFIPNQTIYKDELRVPQEWIDIPSWVGDYYLAVQVNPDDKWVRIWGYTTHEPLKNKGKYDARDRSYYLLEQNLIENINILWVARRVCPNEPTRAKIKPLPTLTRQQTANLLQCLGNPELKSPRLEESFEMWASLLENDIWREELYQRRHSLPIIQASCENSEDKVIFLRDWKVGNFQAGWERGTEDSEIKAHAASVCSIEPTIGIKNFYLCEEIGRVFVFVKLIPKDEKEEDILVKVKKDESDGQAYLPCNFKLVFLSKTGEIVDEKPLKKEKKQVKLNNILGKIGDSFSIQLSFNEISLKENFIL